MGMGMAQRSQPELAPERRLPPGDGPRRDTVKAHNTQGKHPRGRRQAGSLWTSVMLLVSPWPCVLEQEIRCGVVERSGSRWGAGPPVCPLIAAGTDTPSPGRRVDVLDLRSGLVLTPFFRGGWAGVEKRVASVARHCHLRWIVARPRLGFIFFLAGRREAACSCWPLATVSEL